MPLAGIHLLLADLGWRAGNLDDVAAALRRAAAREGVLAVVKRLLRRVALHHPDHAQFWELCRQQYGAAWDDWTAETRLQASK